MTWLDAKNVAWGAWVGLALAGAGCAGKQGPGGDTGDTVDTGTVDTSGSEDTGPGADSGDTGGEDTDDSAATDSGECTLAVVPATVATPGLYPTFDEVGDTDDDDRWSPGSGNAVTFTLNNSGPNDSSYPELRVRVVGGGAAFDTDVASFYGLFQGDEQTWTFPARVEAGRTDPVVVEAYAGRLNCPGSVACPPENPVRVTICVD